VLVGSSGNSGFPGALDEVRVLNFAASASQISSDFGGGPMSAISGTVALWHFDDARSAWCCPSSTTCGADQGACLGSPSGAAACPAGSALSGTMCCPGGGSYTGGQCVDGTCVPGQACPIGFGCNSGHCTAAASAPLCSPTCAGGCCGSGQVCSGSQCCPTGTT